MILDGKKLSLKIKEQVKKEVKDIFNETKKLPKLAVVIVGDDPASKIYVRNKKKACEFVGFESVEKELPASTTQQQLEDVLEELNLDDSVNGILLQLPIPKHLNTREAINCISSEKDVDGLSNLNLGKLVANEPCLTACTPTGILTLLKEYNIALEGKNVAIINRSLLVGKPLQQLLTNENATVTLCHSKTLNLQKITKKADIVVSAVGHENFLKANMIKKGAVVIDVSMNRGNNGLCGDADFEHLKNKASFITPVPGGVGPLTIATLMQNTLKAFKTQNNIK